MELYTIINDKTKWNNHLKGDGLFKAEKYSKEQAEEFLKAVNDYALKDCYSYSYEHDDYNDKSSGGGIYYHEINVDELLICEDKVVGVIFVTKHIDICHYAFVAVVIHLAEGNGCALVIRLVDEDVLRHVGVEVVESFDFLGASGVGSVVGSVVGAFIG